VAVGPNDPSPDGGLDAVLRALHDAAQARGEPMYQDPGTGLWVQTAASLAERGECCGSGCRHCPYPPDEQARAGRPG
jgi:hypothetical protein